MDEELFSELPPDEATLAREAVEVLEENWLGHATRPSPRLYPHQWSWDAAFVAIGYSRYDQSKAERELRSLFAGQWSNGMLPHMSSGVEDYFPGPDFWQTTRSPWAARDPLTSGIVQPPIHATAALRIFENAEDRNRARAFLERLLPRSTAWHGYLRRERCRTGAGTVEIWHPWESGMDNSPLWDEALARLPGTDIPYLRKDLQHADELERPTDDDYDRYVALVALFREHAYHPDRIREATPFAILDVLYNALFAQANRDLAAIATIVGADDSYFRRWAREVEKGVQDHLWNERYDCYVDFDLVAGGEIATQVGASFAPLYAGIPSADQAKRMVGHLTDMFGVRLDENTWMVPSYGSEQPDFLPTNYWRGPIWINVNWVLYQGLKRYGFDEQAASLRSAVMSLVRSSGFWEHYDPVTGEGHGAERFAWTAALVLDLVFDG